MTFAYTEDVTLVVNGVEYVGWEKANVSWQLDASARSFSLEIAESSRDSSWPIAPHDSCQLFAGSDLLIDGYIEDYKPSFTPTSHRISVSGKSKSVDLSETAHAVPNHECRGMTPKQIAGMLSADPTLIDWQISAPTVDIERFGYDETAFEGLARLARHVPRAVLHPKAEGMVQIKALDGAIHQTALVQGQHPWIDGSAHFSAKGEVSEVEFAGQRPVGEGDSAMRLQARANNAQVPRIRRRRYLSEDDIDLTRLNQRADWRIRGQAEMSRSGRARVYGWRDMAGAATGAGGSFWTPGWLIYVSSSFLKLDCALLVNAVTLNQDADSGTTASLTLVDPATKGLEGEAPTDHRWSAQNVSSSAKVVPS